MCLRQIARRRMPRERIGANLSLESGAVVLFPAIDDHSAGCKRKPCPTNSDNGSALLSGDRAERNCTMRRIWVSAENWSSDAKPRLEIGVENSHNVCFYTRYESALSTLHGVV